MKASGFENKSTIDVHKNSFVETDMPSGRGRNQGLPAGRTPYSITAFGLLS
jgi:hypothetical protein